MALKKTPKNITLELPPPPEPFDGFTSKTFSFLHGLKKKNNKDWFEAHRADYEQELREPCKQFVTVMAAHLAETDFPLIADQRRSLFRINRDIRFSKDKSPYKTHIGIVFPLAGLGEEEWAGMYMSFEPKGRNDITSYVGGGAYQPSAPFLKAIRGRIATDYARFSSINNSKAFRKEFPEGITGESLIRMPKGYDEDHPAAKYLKLKEFLYGSDLTIDDLKSPKLPQIVIKKIAAAMPMLTFLAGKD